MHPSQGHLAEHIVMGKITASFFRKWQSSFCKKKKNAYVILENGTTDQGWVVVAIDSDF